VGRGDRSAARLQDERSEEAAVIEAAYRTLAAREAAAVSVAEILREAGLSTRAFYRHFRSKDDLLLAMFRSDSRHVQARLEMVVATAPTPWRALVAWIDELLRIGYDPRRARRVRVLTAGETRSANGYATAYDEMLTAQRSVLVDILERGRADSSLPLADPGPDARAIQSIVSRLLEDASLGVATVAYAEALRHTTAFAGRALGARGDDDVR
jgi:AcrR family transcriptional regulator